MTRPASRASTRGISLTDDAAAEVRVLFDSGDAAGEEARARLRLLHDALARGPAGGKLLGLRQQ